MCDNYLINYHKTELLTILKDSSELKNFSIYISFLILFDNEPVLGNKILKNAESALEEWNKAAQSVQNKIIVELNEVSNIIFKPKVTVRIYGLPVTPEQNKSIFPTNDDSGKFFQIFGTVVRITVAKLLEFQREYICAKCKNSMLVKAEYDMKNVMTSPKKCTACGGCNIRSLGEMDADSCKDYQEIKVQEQVNQLEMGSMPCSIWITLEDDLVDSCKPGDNVTICGIVKRRYDPLIKSKKIKIELVVRANHVQINNAIGLANLVTAETVEIFEDYWKKHKDSGVIGRDLILRSFCPQIFGLHLVKLAVAVVLAGGTQIQESFTNLIQVRSEPHLLLVGDPGTGKSQLLRFASKVVPRSVLTTGIGSTAAGLTVAAVMEEGEWQLEGGALVLADGGICCIDEFNSMKPHDRTSIHEAMEQQTISVAKASIVCKLSTKCSILAATNPKGNIDLSQPLNMNIALESPLLSRFDLIFLIRDTVQQEWDSCITEYILNGQSNPSELMRDTNWSVEMLQAYFAIVKKINPLVSEDADSILTKYYQVHRKMDSRNKSRTTVRMLNSLVRLSQGHARLMYHKEVEIIDAIMAVILVECGLDAESRIFNLNVDVQSNFPENHADYYTTLCLTVLNKLNLEFLWEKVNIFDNLEAINVRVESRYFTKSDENLEQNNKENDAKEQQKRKRTSTMDINLDSFEQEPSREISKTADNNLVLEKDKNSCERKKININSQLMEHSNIFADGTDFKQPTNDKNATKEKVSQDVVATTSKKGNILKKQRVLNPLPSTSKNIFNMDVDSFNFEICDNLNPQKKKKKIPENNFIENELNMINLLPSVNDDIDGIDFDFLNDEEEEITNCVGSSSTSTNQNEFAFRLESPQFEETSNKSTNLNLKPKKFDYKFKKKVDSNAFDRGTSHKIKDKNQRELFQRTQSSIFESQEDTDFDF